MPDNWIQPERIYSIVDAVLKGKRRESPIPDWNNVPAKLKEVRQFLESKYAIAIQKWNPMSSWIVE